MVKRIVTINPLHFPVDVYHYDVKLLTSIDGGENYYYAGFGKFARNMNEALTIKQKLEQQNDIKEGRETR